ncbi:MAG: LLM class flavin-dependent oxidoreductase, partial [Chloroflexota bacterium]|nr:LLM class flavin-dependent oxidoreductase [Chloroflexota bacterium]
LPFHHPIRLAQEVATLDQLSRGRVEFGTGIGVHEHEFIRWGVDYYQRAAVSEEVLKIVKMAWTQDEVTYQGKYFQFDEAFPHPKPYQQPHPPIWAAVHSDAAVEFAARNNYNVAQNIDTDEVVARKFDLYRRIWKECGHPGPMPRVFLQRSMFVAETDAKALEIARQYSGAGEGAGTRFGGAIAQTRIGWGSHPRGMGRDSERADDAARARTMEESRRNFDFARENGLVLVGSPDTVTRRLQEGRQRIGYDLFVVSPMMRMPKEVHRRSMELFGKEVIPNSR